MGRILFLPLLGMLAAAIALVLILALASLLANERARTIAKLLLAVPAVAFLVGVLSVATTVRVKSDRAGATSVARAHNETADDATASEIDDELLAADELFVAGESSSETSEEGEATTEERPAAATRPDWVEAAPQKLGGVYRMAVKCDPSPSRLECQGELLPDALDRAVAEYVDKRLKLGRQAARQVRLPLDFIRGHIVKGEWEEPVEVSFGTWVQLHVLLEFDHEVNARIEEEWDKVITRERLRGVGGLMAAVLLLLSGIYVYLKIDLATSGAYRGRLRLAAAAVLLAVIAAGLLLAAS